MILHFGVIDIPYADDAISTGEVAEILEQDYQVMEGYRDLHLNAIAQSLENSLAGSLETLMMGGQVTNPFNSAMSSIEQGFRHYLDMEEIAKLGRKGVPTKAALKGASKRFKRFYGARRPSFIDTGLYQSSFKAWVE